MTLALDGRAPRILHEQKGTSLMTSPGRLPRPVSVQLRDSQRTHADDAAVCHAPPPRRKGLRESR